MWQTLFSLAKQSRAQPAVNPPDSRPVLSLLNLKQKSKDLDKWHFNGCPLYLSWRCRGSQSGRSLSRRHFPFHPPTWAQLYISWLQIQSKHLLLDNHTDMTLIGGFGIIALLILQGADVGETKTNSLNEPDVPFPPARPTAQNLAAICLQGQGRPRYLSSFFPNSRVSHFRRRGDAINRLESWFGLCCSGLVALQSDQILCCAQQAWKQALSQFCVEEFSTMTNAYVCCSDRGDARWTCFNSELPNPNYDPTPGYTAPLILEEPGFTFNANAC